SNFNCDSGSFLSYHIQNQAKAKIDNLTVVLHDHKFVSYTEDEVSYTQKFEELIQEYSSLENLMIDIIPYSTDEEIKDVEKDVSQRFKMRRWLSKDLTYFHPKENFFLHPLYIYDKKYVLKGTPLNETKNITETDVQAINLLFITYSLMVEVQPKEADVDG
ncbi:type II toxin-antitoxin system SpoIISA family toxin, partial [Oceanobacillus indicireducens]|uniref:type II toxin-antitoxin system SpoIISA family toxin n=1 Tax=Oceanobacillus indicireducens TaxID=1004261 RepID=UPI00166F1B66